MQLMNVHDADTSEGRYLDVIHCKTAKLFEAATRLGAVIAGEDEDRATAMARYGMHLGTAFQLIDDVMDYSSTAEDMGKNVGDDLAEGKPTLPLIYAMQQGSESQAALIRKAIEKGGYDYIDDIQAIIEQTGALEYTEAMARNEAAQASLQLRCLPETEFRQALEILAEYSARRSS